MWWTDTSMNPYPATRYVSSYHKCYYMAETLPTQHRFHPTHQAPDQMAHVKKKTADKQCDVPESSCNHNLGWTNTPVIPSHQPPPIQKELRKVEEQKTTKFPSQNLISAGAYANLLQKCHFHHASPGLLLQRINFKVWKGSNFTTYESTVLVFVSFHWFVPNALSPILQLSHHFLLCQVTERQAFRHKSRNPWNRFMPR